MRNEIIQYIRNKHRDKIGILLANVENGSVIRIGYSLKCKRDKNFNREFGIKIARARALNDRPFKVPRSIHPQFKHFEERAGRYFREHTLVRNSEVCNG